MQKFIEKIKYLYNHKTYNIVFFIPFFIVLFIYINYSEKENREDLKKNGCYTIAKTKGTHYKYKSEMKVAYEYFYKGKKYEDYDNYGDLNINKNGGYYLVKVSKLNPENNEINLRMEVTESNYTTLPYGTSRLPCDCSKDSVLLWFNRW